VDAPFAKSARRRFDVDGLNSAVDIFRLKRKAGLRKLLGGLDYTRCVEYPEVLNQLQLESAHRVLEVGSSRLFLAPYLAIRHGVEVHATDQDPVVMLQKSWIRKLGHADLLDAGRFVVAQEDATRLTYADESFDRIVCVSTIEHIQETERAARELGRVLEPGGLAGFTVPFSRRPREVYLEHDFYGKTYSGTPLFYEYIFDRSALEKKLIQPSGLQQVSLTFLGEPRIKASRVVFSPVIGKPLSFARWLWPWMAKLFLKPIDERQVTAGTENIAVLILRKRTREDPVHR
jgi:ubiquinone/menaquinone biosynthesis C-methylase UbiE